MTAESGICVGCENETLDWCERCEEPCCESCFEYLETHAPTRIDPGDGIAICPNCSGNIEADRESWEETMAEHRAEARAADRESQDDRRW